MSRRFSLLTVGASLVVIAIAALIMSTGAASVASTTSLPSAPDPLSIFAPPLTLQASVANWTWVGSGNLCYGGTGEMVANFVANASGGSPPYGFRWDFGDGTPVSTEQNPSHAYATHGLQYNVTVSVTDTSGATATTTFSVTPRSVAFNCPAILIPLPKTGPSVLPVVAIVVGVAVGVALVGLLSRRRWGWPPRPH